MRNRYFARSEPGSDDQPFANALARSGDRAVDVRCRRLADRARAAPRVDGEIVSYVSDGSIHSPPTKSP